MKVPSRIQERIDSQVIQPIRNASVMALAALVCAIIALIVAVVKK